MKKRNVGKKHVQFLAAAALTAALMAGQIQPMAVYGGEKSIKVSSLIPDNVTVEQPVPLSEISLPSSEYGTLSWADSSSVPSKRVQTYDVIFKPYDGVELSRISGWDGKSETVYGSVTVVVSSIEEEWEESDQEEWTEETEEENTEEQDNISGEEIPEAPDSDSNEAEEGQKETEETPEATVTPEAEETPEATVTPEAEETPEATVTPEAEETPEATVTPEAEETPETTVTPEAEETPETTVMPEAEETPEATVTPEAEETPEATVTPEAEEENIFDREEEKEDTRPAEMQEDELTEEEQAAAAETNHSCNGISVSGISLPWYVQFRATTGEEYQFTNEDEANVFKSYEFELWDLKNQKEYEIPDGEYISVTVPVKAGYTYTIEHLLDNGAMETIVPSVEGSTMVFSTHSFSPFGIAGSKPLVGEEIQEDGYNGSSSSSTIVKPTATTAPVDNTEAAGQDSANSAGTSVQEDNSSKEVSQENDQEQAKAENESQGDSVGAVNTGDDTPVLAFVILAVVAIVIVGVIIYLRRRKK